MRIIVIGSGSDAHVRLNSPYVSGYHAELLLLDNGDILLTDKGSKNGTFVNDRRIQPNNDVSVKRGDKIRFADTQLNWAQVPTIVIDFAKIKEMRSVGTNYKNKYQLQGEKSSRFHATFKKYRTDGKWYIQDHSKNGTTVNGRVIPSNQDIRIKKGDVILCAGEAVHNPADDEVTINFKIIGIVASILLVLGGAVYAMIEYIVFPPPTWSDEKIYDEYNSSLVLLVGAYRLEVSAGHLDLKELGIESEFEQMLQPIIYTGTGFYVSEKGVIMTNLHVARPWTNPLVKERMTALENGVKQELAKLAGLDKELSILNAYLNQVRVEGRLMYIGAFSNGVVFDEENMVKCLELYAHDDIDKDIALLQMVTKSTPEGCKIVDVYNSVEDTDITVGSHVFTMGYPYGGEGQDLENLLNGIHLYANGGAVSQDLNKYSFYFNAPSFGGASGSPLFSSQGGKLIGILSAGRQGSDNFNIAIKASHARELLDNARVK